MVQVLRLYRFPPYVWVSCFLSVMCLSGQGLGPKAIASTQRLELRDKVLEMFNHAYNAYMTNAYPADELMPIACKGRIRGVTPSRGDIDDTLGNFSLTLVDTLDTLALLGLHDEFEVAVRRVERDVSLNADLLVSVFETNIRMLGGLLGGHSAALELQESHNRMKWYNGSLLRMAKELGDRLLPAFNTSTGMPMSRINLSTGSVRRLKDRDTCTACAGTTILEMSALSRFTGDPVYEDRAREAMDYLWSRRQRSSDLMGTVLNVENGEWVRKESGIGAGIDSYYEYLLKAYILLGDDTYLHRFNTHYQAINKLHSTPLQAIKQYVAQGPMMIDVLMHKPTTAARNFIDALSAFWPGLQVLKGDLKSAIETHELLYQVFTRHTFLPEAFTTSFDVHWGQYPLRPEFAESTYLLYKATGDPYYLQVGKTILENLESRARVECGYAGIKDVRTFTHEDRMDSYFLAEMFKYLYLLFSSSSEDLGINIDNYVLTTEAHLLPLKLSLLSPHNKTKTKFTLSSVDRSCSNSDYVKSGNLRSIHELRSTVKVDAINVKQPTQCPNSPNNPTPSPTQWVGPRTLKASELIPNNQQHIAILKRMGITMVVLKDGKIQLVQHHNMASTPRDATEGTMFMHEMMELSKKAEAPQNPLYIQILSRPYKGSLALRAQPAQFGPSFDSIEGGVSGYAVISDPVDGCSNSQHPVKGKIVVAERGSCMFVQKAKVAESQGAVGIIITDNVADSSFEGSSPFAMAGDDETIVNIPAMFLFTKEGGIIRDLIRDAGELRLFLSNHLKPLREIMLEEIDVPADVSSDTNNVQPPPVEVSSDTVSEQPPPTKVSSDTNSEQPPPTKGEF
uniref:ER degradation-enhancing alpha-mannosidase-like protein 3 isoform X3 n=1 Tax=Ciona intestinalis TaxID=7719 RepID=UPI000EF46A7C|nr:ER degradation-enhancing alpha-mannosidase-like protein 3 isoform X3 [Ciona intestinalis]|eukprot:XP_026695542.1 ER degradation-enhancing alpha-mannosidase-like protein 3 isoform X3 [Ciona intestinalis]